MRNGRGGFSTARVHVRVESGIGVRLNAAARPVAQLESEIELGGIGTDLNFLARAIEAEHVDFHVPRAGRHTIESKGAAVVGDREQNAVALRGLDSGSGNRLALGLHHTALGETHTGD